MTTSFNLCSRFAHQSADSMREQYGISHQDLARIQAFAADVEPRLGAMIERWYDWLKTQPEYDQYFSDGDTLQRVQGLQHDYWLMFMSGTVDDTYVERRRRVGEAHARIGLPLNTYFAGMNRFLDCFREVAIEAELGEEDRLATQHSVTKLLHLDTAIVVDTYNAMVEDTLTAQSQSLLEMSTPVTHIWDGILLLPIVGLIDSRRARDIMNATLEKIAESQARIFILDISGVGVVDTAVANHLIKISRATRLMGCECVISGVSPSIAHTVVDLGIEVGDIKTTATMKDALATAFSQLGMSIARED
jgi:rsbT co-antagonist protein RsbR